jgi:hypothetical protein
MLLSPRWFSQAALTELGNQSLPRLGSVLSIYSYKVHPDVTAI